MARIAGVTIKKSATGKPTHVTLSIKQHGKFLEDYLDHLDIASRKNEETIPWEVAKKKLDKKHGFKD